MTHVCRSGWTTLTTASSCSWGQRGFHVPKDRLQSSLLLAFEFGRCSSCSVELLRASTHIKSDAVASAAKVVKKGGEILMTGKAYNNRCIQQWLEKVMRDAAAVYPDHELIGHMSVCMMPGSVYAPRIMYVCYPGSPKTMKLFVYSCSSKITIST